MASNQNKLHKKVNKQFKKERFFCNLPPIGLHFPELQHFRLESAHVPCSGLKLSPHWPLTKHLTQALFSQTGLFESDAHPPHSISRKNIKALKSNRTNFEGMLAKFLVYFLYLDFSHSILYQSDMENNQNMEAPQGHPLIWLYIFLL